MMAKPNGSVERELKFEAPRGFRLDELDGEPIEPHELSSVYYDTARHRLLDAGITLRRRTDKNRVAWQLKLPRAEDRLELEVDSVAETAPDSFRSLLGNLLDEPLEPIGTLLTNRRGRRVHGVEVTVDEVRVTGAATTKRTFTEIEAELVDGTERDLQRVARALRKLGAQPAPYRTKVERLVSPRQPTSRRTRGRARLMIAKQLHELRSHEPGARLGDDPEDVHQMRVAVRRLRSILRRLDAPAAEGLRSELDWIGASLGAVRDADVLSARLHGEAELLSGGDAAKASELLQPLRHERSEAQTQLVADLDSERYGALLDALDATASDRAFTIGKRALRKAARKQFHSAVKGGKLSPAASAAAIHKRRIRIKRARYITELAYPKGRRKLIAAAEGLQEVLGAHQDAVVARRRLRGLARQASSKDAALLAGRLIEREETRILRSRSEIPKLWRTFQRAGPA